MITVKPIKNLRFLRLHRLRRFRRFRRFRFTALIPIIAIAICGLGLLTPSFSQSARKLPQPCPNTSNLEWENLTDAKRRDMVRKIYDTASYSDPCFYATVLSLVASNSAGGKLRLADTLYGALDKVGRLDPHELLRYGRVKCLLGDYRSAAALYCRAIALDRRMEHAATTQMGLLFADADSADKVAAVERFKKCALAIPDSDTASIRNWVADFYGRNGLFEREITTLATLSIPSSPAGRKLADAAKEHLSKRRYRLAATGAAAAYNHFGNNDGASADAAYYNKRSEMSDKDLRPNTAFAAYQAYTRLGIRDSALIWLRLSGMDKKDARAAAAALNQETGHLKEAAALIDSLPPSLSKDTLMVRQHIFSGEPDAALNEILSSFTSTSWIMNPRDKMLWRARCMIFGGRASEAAPILDSIKFAPPWHGASTVLKYKYWLQKLDDNRGALLSWSRLEHLIYIGDLSGAIKTFKGYRMDGEIGEMLAVRLSGELSKSARFAEALEVLESIDKKVNTNINIDINIDVIVKNNKSARGPEYLYAVAETLNEIGRTEESRAIAQKILTDFPSDIFAQKTRILLKSKSN